MQLQPEYLRGIVRFRRRRWFRVGRAEFSRVRQPGRWLQPGAYSRHTGRTRRVHLETTVHSAALQEHSDEFHSQASDQLRRDEFHNQAEFLVTTMRILTNHSKRIVIALVIL